MCSLYRRNIRWKLLSENAAKSLFLKTTLQEISLLEFSSYHDPIFECTRIPLTSFAQSQTSLNPFEHRNRGNENELYRNTREKGTFHAALKTFPKMKQISLCQRDTDCKWSGKPVTREKISIPVKKFSRNEEIAFQIALAGC